MIESVVLSKIGKTVEEGNDKQYIFSCKQKTWQWLDPYEKDAAKLLEILRMSEVGKVKDVVFAESNDGKFLLVQYFNILHYRVNRKTEELIDNLFKILFNKRCVPSVANKEDELDVDKQLLKGYVTTKLFASLQVLHKSMSGTKTLEISSLTLPPRFLPVLCHYQKESLLWLLSKETAPETISAFFEKLNSKDGETEVYKHLYSRCVRHICPPSIVLPPGGILADEMGLGKTVEVLGLILLNPRTQDKNPELYKAYTTILSKRKAVEQVLFCICTSKSTKEIIQCNKCYLWQHSRCVSLEQEGKRDCDAQCPYICPSCWQQLIEETGLIRSKATLIVSPNTIKLQWLSEIKRHIQPTLSVFIYNGVVSGKWICPSDLSDYDIILTDYNVLRGEVYFTADNVSERTTRNKPKTIRMHSPLLMVEWWRVCLDEAQMVESNTSKVSSLVRIIPAVNRWAITGTPIQRSLDDLQPLLKFVGFDVAAEANTWNYLVHDFLTNHNKEENANALELVKVLQKCMWRTCKSQVAHEIQIPPQQEIVHYVEFDNWEMLFYNEQHAECRANFTKNVHKYAGKMSTISPKVMKVILHPFLKIRQSCTMPVVVTNSHTSSAVVTQQKQFLQPNELHDYLKSTNEMSCKSELRAMASSHNGLAGLYFLLGNHEEALKHYEAVLKLASEYNDINLTVDSLLQIHAIHNFIIVKKKQSECYPLKHSPHLDHLEAQYNSLEWKYLNAYSTTLAAVMTSYTTALAKEISEPASTLITLISKALCGLLETEVSVLLQKIYEECMPRFGNTNSKLTEIQSVHSLLYVIDVWFKKLETTLRRIQTEINDLNYFIENVKPRHQIDPNTWRKIMELVHSTYDCHLSQIRENEKAKKTSVGAQKKPKCKLCSLREYINNFECLIFDKVIHKTSCYTGGMEKPSFEMFLCKLSFSYLKNKQTHMLTITALEKYWSYLESLQNVCKRVIKLWIEMEYTVKAYDELDMCKMRISITEDSDEKSNFKILEPEIEQRLVDHKNDLFAAEREFVRKLARLRYINHLKNNEETAACPICHLVEQDRYAVLECGHHICIQCLQSIRQYSKSSSFKCSVCRNVQLKQNVFYISRSYANQIEDNPISGNYSSKISYVVRLILKIQKEDYGNDPCDHRIDKTDRITKILIFSQWPQILNAIGLALKENKITFRLQCTPKTLEDFKNPYLGVTCLLMPFIKGSKGLNLVEATHVFLVEPILNPGEELQAIGRVHRFGQKRSTTIHRFIMRGSIEENIFKFINSSSTDKKSSNGWEFENVSLDDFSKLFRLEANESLT